MVPVLILGIALLVGLVLLGRWFVQADPKQVAHFVRWLVLGLGVLFVLFVVVSGRWAWLPGAAFAVLPWLNRFRALSTIAKNMRGPTPGQRSNVETDVLRMSLDHDTGEMDGEVLTGPYRGRRLSSMSLPELISLWEDCTGRSQQSQAVLESYLDRVHGANWRHQTGEGPRGGRSGDGKERAFMSEAEAREVLGLEADASEEEIEQAYRRLMLKMHPDQGGSDYLAAKINQAKEVLLGR